MVIFQVSRQSEDIGTLKSIVCFGWGPWTRNKGVDRLLETGESFVDGFDLLLTSKALVQELKARRRIHVRGID